jgi:hypothetical protein
VRLVAVVGCALTLVLVGAAPASAHGIGVSTPTNYETRVTRVDPAVAGLSVTAIETGKRLEIRNGSGAEVTVIGYDGEPYVRVGAQGVFENRHSPTWFRNRTLKPTLEELPEGVGAQADPEWVKVSDGSTARIHWHPAHWMGTERPPEAAESPGRTHVIATWDLVMRRSGTDVTVRGDLRWLPDRSPFPWILVAGGLLAATVLAGRTRAWRWVLVAGLGVLVAAETVHLAGAWTASYAAVPGRVVQNVYSIGGIVLGSVAVWRLCRPADPRASTPLALVAGIVLAVAGGLTDLSSLAKPVLTTDLSPPVARALVATVLGVGIGIVIVAATHLARPESEVAPSGFDDARRSA